MIFTSIVPLESWHRTMRLWGRYQDITWCKAKSYLAGDTANRPLRTRDNIRTNDRQLACARIHSAGALSWLLLVYVCLLFPSFVWILCFLPFGRLPNWIWHPSRSFFGRLYRDDIFHRDVRTTKLAKQDEGQHYLKAGGLEWQNEGPRI